MAETDLLLIIVPILISLAALATAILSFTHKANTDAVSAVAAQFQDLQKRVSHLEGRQQERDNKGAV